MVFLQSVLNKEYIDRILAQNRLVIFLYTIFPYPLDTLNFNMADTEPTESTESTAPHNSTSQPQQKTTPTTKPAGTVGPAAAT